MATETFYTATDEIEVEYEATSSDYLGHKEWEIDIYAVEIMGVAFPIEAIPGLFIIEIKEKIIETLA